MQVKRVLILGNGGREHVLARAYAKSREVVEVFVLPGNGLIGVFDKKIIPLTGEKSDFLTVLNLCRRLKIDLVDVAQDSFLASGYVDKLQEAGIPTFGPTQKVSEIEWSKSYSRNFMEKYGLPIPHFSVFSDALKARRYIETLPEGPLYIKASGLALGKGAIRAENRQEALLAVTGMEKFGKAGETFLVEECMTGEEFSYFALCDGRGAVSLGWAQDHKTVNNKNMGPNTGGMGCVAPAAVVTKKIVRDVERKIIRPFLRGMEREGRLYSGVLYIGCMLTKTGIKIVEFNARWGDPEAEVLVPSIKTDYLEIVKAVLEKKVVSVRLKLDKKVRVSVAGCAYGYPVNYSQVMGKEVFGLEALRTCTGVSVFGSGISRRGGKFKVNGGRVFHVSGEGKTLSEARKAVYGAMSLLYIEGDNLHYRTDIGWRDVERLT